MNLIKVSGLLGKAVIASVVFVTLFSNAAKGMFLFSQPSLDVPSQVQGEWDQSLEQLETWFSNQEYESLFKSIHYFLEAEEQRAIDWLKNKSLNNHDVACTYELIRRSLKNGNLGLWGTEELSNMLVSMILSLVQTKADVDCCTILSHKYKNPTYNPYDIIKDNYHHRLRSRQLLQQHSYSDIIQKAGKVFDHIQNDNFPLPIWICTVDYGRTEHWVYFGDPKNLELESKERGTLRNSYNLKKLVDEVKILRKKSFENTWEKLCSLSGWDEFFALNASGFKELSDLSDLNTSIVSPQSQINDAIEMEIIEQTNNDQ